MLSPLALTPLLAVLAPGSLNHTANIIKGFAIAIGIAIAIGFVWMWWAHRVRERRQELSARARSVYATALRTGIQHPELAEPMLGVISSPADIVRYKHFVASQLATADEILALDPSASWRAVLVRHLTPHKSYLASEEFRLGVLPTSTTEVQGVIKQVVGT
ncbi:MAG: hypothetical protein ACKVP7_20850 [Hyphomicrobiaceae bacterium]